MTEMIDFKCPSCENLEFLEVEEVETWEVPLSKGIRSLQCRTKCSLCDALIKITFKVTNVEEL